MGIGIELVAQLLRNSIGLSVCRCHGDSAKTIGRERQCRLPTRYGSRATRHVMQLRELERPRRSGGTVTVEYNHMRLSLLDL